MYMYMYMYNVCVDVFSQWCLILPSLPPWASLSISLHQYQDAYIVFPSVSAQLFSLPPSLPLSPLPCCRLPADSAGGEGGVSREASLGPGAHLLPQLLAGGGPLSHAAAGRQERLQLLHQRYVHVHTHNCHILCAQACS